MNELLVFAPSIISQLGVELVRRGEEEHKLNPESQLSACFSLALRSLSLLCSVGKLLTPQTRDGVAVLMRAFLESRDLLMTFRFDETGTRQKVTHWYEGKLKSPWKAEHKKCEEFFEKLGHNGSNFAQNWSAITTLSHPTKFAADTSVACATLWAARPKRTEDFVESMGAMIADYLTSIVTLIVIATIDLPGLVPMGCDPSRMPDVDRFQSRVSQEVVPILNANPGNLPPDSYRS